MGFLDTVEQARAFLERNGRVSLGALRLEFDLDEAQVETLVEELADIQQVAARDGKAIAWVGSSTAASPVADPTVAERSPRDYTPKHLAEKILQSKSALEGERKQVTVLFADVKGSMELAEQLDAEEWHRILDRFFEILSEGVHRFEGTVNQYTGDGIMALFGAPIAHEDHARRACFAALHLREGLREFTREVKRRHGLDFAVRIGLNSGEVIVGKIGDDLRMDYTAQGHTVGLAQRMEALAPGGSIYLSDRTAGLVSGYFDLEDLGEFAVKGSSKPMPAFELHGVGDARTPFDLARARGLNRFVGRSDEMALIEAALEQALAGPGRTIGVVAQAGTGKTRLCHEFALRCRARGLTVYEARGLAHGKKIALLPAVELLRDFFAIDEHDGDRAREKITRRVLALDESLEEELPIFFDLLGVPDPTRPLPAVDPALLQRRMYATVQAIIQAAQVTDPGVVLLEDLHWLDPASDAVFEQVIEAVAGSRGLVVVNFRPEYRGRWMERSHYQELSLAPLSEAALRELLRDLLGDDPSIAPLPAAIHAQTRGNPFFIEEVVRSLIEDGYLEGSRGAYRLLIEFETLPLPQSVQGVLAARIDRLPEREKQVLQAASVIGKTFRGRVLERVADCPEAALAEALQNLQDGEFLYPTAHYPEREYSFKHPLTQEVAERSQLSDRRKRAHAAVARAIEELDAQQLDERAALLAHHWERADEAALASRWHARAAGRLGATDYGESYAHWRRVDELLEEVESNAEMGALRGRAFVEQLKLAFRVGIQDEAAAALFSRGRDFIRARGDDRALAELLCAFAALRENVGDLVEYAEFAEEAAATARRTGDPVLRAAITLDLAWSRMLRGSLAEAAAAADEGAALVGDDAELGADLFGWSPRLANLGVGAFALALMGRVEEADQCIIDAFRFVPDRTPLEILAWLHGWRAEVELSRGNSEQALHAGRRCLELAEGSGSPHCAVFARCWLAEANAAHQSWHEAADLMEQARALSRETRAASDSLVMSSWVLPAAYLGLGEIARARALAEEAIELCSAQRSPVFLCRAFLARAAVFRSGAAADVVRAKADLDAAERLAEETGARPFLAAILEERACLSTGAARERRLRKAHQLYVDMGATGHAARVARELEGEGGA